MPSFFKSVALCLRRQHSCLIVQAMGLAVIVGVGLSNLESAQALSNASAQGAANDPAALILKANQTFHGLDLTDKDGPLHKIGFDLALLQAEYQAFMATPSGMAAFQSAIPLLPVVQTSMGTFVTIDAIADHDVNQLQADLVTLGLQNAESFGPMVSGQLPITAIEPLAALASLRFARPAIAITHGSAIVGQADIALTADQVRRQFGVTGLGVRVGVLSDSYNCLGGAAADVASGDLPTGITVLAEEAGCARGKDEGRALMQLIADSAPDTEQAFHTAFGGQASFANSILNLADLAQADILVDDVSYLAEPMFQDGIIAQAVDQVAAAGVTFFSSAGNAGRQSYESPFTAALGLLPVPVLPGLLHDFDPGAGVDPLQTVTIPVGATATFTLQWDQPYASVAKGNGATSDLDFFLLGSSLTKLAFSIDKNIGRDPIETLKYTNPGPGTTFSLAVAHLLGPRPGLLKYIYTGTGVTIDEYATRSSTLYGHANAAGALAVGAAFYVWTPAFGVVPPLLEPFSAAGPTPILFDRAGSPITQRRFKPELVAPDGANTTFFGQDIPDPGDGSDLDALPNFFGTSASAAHAAATAALMLAANPALSPSEIRGLLEQTAIDMGPAGFDADSGYGLLQALPAVSQAIQHDIVSTQTSSSATALPGQPISYRLAFTNQGPQLARALIITNTLPAALHQVNTSSQTLGGSGTLTTFDLTPAFQWGGSGFGVGAGGIITITGIVDPQLKADATLVNRTQIASRGDLVLANNQSQATVDVRLPRVQLEGIGAIAADGSRYLTVTLDVVNPYADVTVGYQTTNYPTPGNPAATGSRGTVTIGRGQKSAVFALPALDSGVGETGARYVQLEQSLGALVGQRSVMALTANPDGDSDGLLDALEDDNGDSDSTNDDLDGDGIPNYLDPDDDGDGINTINEDRNQNGNFIDDDSDGDGQPDYRDLTNTNPCLPNPNATACGSDPDNDGTPTNNDPPPLDPCRPNPDAVTCATGDADGDGTQNSLDPAPLDVCLPTPTQVSCQLAASLTPRLYLPLVFQ